MSDPRYPEAGAYLDEAFRLVEGRMLVSYDVRKTAEWYRDTFGFEIRPNTFGDCMLALKGFGQAMLIMDLHEIRKDRDRESKLQTLEPAERGPCFEVEDAASLRRECIAKRLKLVNDVEIEGLGIGYFGVEDCDGRVIFFKERTKPATDH